MDILAQAQTVNAAPFVGIIGQLIMWFGLIFVLSIMKGWIVQGASIAIGEWLMKQSSDDRESVARWLGDSDSILSYLKRIDEAIKKS